MHSRRSLFESSSSCLSIAWLCFFRDTSSLFELIQAPISNIKSVLELSCQMNQGVALAVFRRLIDRIREG